VAAGLAKNLWYKPVISQYAWFNTVCYSDIRLASPSQGGREHSCPALFLGALGLIWTVLFFKPPYFLQTLTNVKKTVSRGRSASRKASFFICHPEDTASRHCELYLDCGEDTLGELQMQRQILQGNFPQWVGKVSLKRTCSPKPASFINIQLLTPIFQRN